MTGVATAIGVGAAVTAGAAVYSGNKAASAAESAANSAIGENAREFNLARADTQPSRQLGADADAQLSKLYGYGPSQVDPNTGAVTGTPSGTPDMSGFFTSPNYQFALSQGEKSINNSLVAQGRGLSGAALKAGSTFASGLASSNYNDYVNQLMQQAGLGSAAVSTSASAGAAAASNDSQAYALEGNARASAYGNTAAGVNNAVQGGTGNYLLSQYLNRPGTPTYTNTSPSIYSGGAGSGYGWGSSGVPA